MCFSSSSLARTSSSPHTSEEEWPEGQRRPPARPPPTPGGCGPRLTERRLVHQGFAVQVSPVCHEQLHQVHLWAGEPGLLKPAEPPSPPGPTAPQALTWPQ